MMHFIYELLGWFCCVCAGIGLPLGFLIGWINMQSIFDGLRFLVDFTCCGLAGTAIILVFLLVWVRSKM